MAMTKAEKQRAYRLRVEAKRLEAAAVAESLADENAALRAEIAAMADHLADLRKLVDRLYDARSLNTTWRKEMLRFLEERA